jgi:magnesium transporter
VGLITVFHRKESAILSSALPSDEKIPQGALWIDIVNPSVEEEKSIEAQLGIEIPTREETWKNQVLNRLYQDNNVAYMTAAIITKVESPYPQTSAITFVLSSQYLLTIRYISPTSFQNFALRLMRYPQKFPSAAYVLEGLLEEIITRVAYNSEIVVGELDALSHDIFGSDSFRASRKNPSQVMKDILRRLGTSADLNSKINESLHSISRTLNFFRQIQGGDKEVDAGIGTLMTDIMALSQQTGFLASKINFQQDATLGMINIEQNMIIKIFSVVAVFFLPPTLISSIYGMNFAEMPELQWPFGYAYAVLMMALCALVPYFYFRKKGWL